MRGRRLPDRRRRLPGARGGGGRIRGPGRWRLACGRGRGWLRGYWPGRRSMLACRNAPGAWHGLRTPRRRLLVVLSCGRRHGRRPGTHHLRAARPRHPHAAGLRCLLRREVHGAAQPGTIGRRRNRHEEKGKDDRRGGAGWCRQRARLRPRSAVPFPRTCLRIRRRGCHATATRRPLFARRSRSSRRPVRSLTALATRQPVQVFRHAFCQRSQLAPCSARQHPMPSNSPARARCSTAPT